MDKDSIFDDILKEKAQNEKFILPESLNLKIKSTLNNLPERKKKSKTLMKGSIAAAIMLLCGIGITTTNPALARNLPVVSSVFQFLSENNIIDKDYVRYSSDLNMSKTSNGTTVTINSIVYDGIDLNIGYTIQSENEIVETPVIMSETSMKINGKTIGFGGGDTGKFKDKKTYVGIASIDMAMDYLPKEHLNFIVGGNVTIPDNFLMDFNIKKIKNIKMLSNDITGNWDFKFKVSNEKIKTNVKSIKPNIDLSSLRSGLKVNELLITPINTALRTSETEDNNSTGGYIVFDDKGRPLMVKGSSTSGSANTHTYYSQTLFRNVYSDSKALTFIPYVNLNTSNFSKETALNLSGVTTLPEGKLGDYKVTQIEFLNDKTLIHYECSKLLSSIPFYEISIIDSNGKEYDFKRDFIKEIDSLNHKYVAQLPVLNKDSQYKLKAQDYEKKYTVKEDLKFIVKIK
jgi:hypothetical protein